MIKIEKYLTRGEMYAIQRTAEKNGCNAIVKNDARGLTYIDLYETRGTVDLTLVESTLEDMLLTDA